MAHAPRTHHPAAGASGNAGTARHPAPNPPVPDDVARHGAYANPMGAGARRSPDEIERDIEATRARMEARLEGLNHDLAPSTLLKNTLGADINSPTDTLAALYDRARHNPLSAVLIGAGIAALYFGRKADDPQARAAGLARDEYDAHRGVPGPATRDAAERVAYDIQALKGHARNLTDSATETRDRVTGTASAHAAAVADTGRAARDGVDSAREYAAETASTLAESARDTYERATDTVSTAYERASRRAASAYEDASEALSHAPTYARERAEYAGSWVRENPMAAGLIGLAAGATIASVVAAAQSSRPRSRRDATRQLYRHSDGYQVGEELQRRAMRRPSGSTRARPASSTGTLSDAVPGSANPARSTASQAARRAPSTAGATDGDVSTSSVSTVGRTTSGSSDTGSATATPSATPSAANPARSGVNQAARRAPSTATATAATQAEPKKDGAGSKTGSAPSTASGSGTTSGRSGGTGDSGFTSTPSVSSPAVTGGRS